jgi:4-carboxymuconolactone decarboxylase
MRDKLLQYAPAEDAPKLSNCLALFKERNQRDNYKRRKPMRLTHPRIQPLPQSEWDAETRELLEGLRRDGQVYNIFATLARHPKLLKRWLVFGNHILAKSTLPAREREIAILRMGWLCRAVYEWGHHVDIGKQAGLSEVDIQRIAAGPDALGLDPFEAVLLRAVDELHADSFISDDTWQALARRYDTEQLLDLVFTAGQYKLVSMALNSLGVQLEEGFEGFPNETQR